MARGDLTRFSFYERVIHWLSGFSLVYLLITGMAFSYPKAFWLLNLVGGPATARWFHPWVGVVFVVSMILMFRMWAREMRVSREERAWFDALPHYAKHEKDKVPPVGKYNPGQKVYFWLMIVFGVLHLFTGLPLWFPQTFGLGLVPTMRFIHYFITLPSLLLLLAHIYLSTILYPGTARAMLYGTVTRAWARLHHPLWAREKAGD